jgi:hypothetical protein
MDFRLTFVRHVPRIEPGRDLSCHTVRPNCPRNVLATFLRLREPEFAGPHTDNPPWADG